MPPAPGLRSRSLDVLLPSFLYVGFELVARHAFGLEMGIAWHHAQLLDPVDLMERPLPSLLLLHGQPPLFNALLAAAVQGEVRLGVAASASLSACFAALGLLSANLFYRTLRALTASRWIAAAGLVALLSDPAFAWFRHFGFYPFLLLSFHVGLTWGAARYLRRGTLGGLAACSACVALLSLTRTLYHPLWAAGTLALLLALRAARTGLAGALPRHGAPVLAAAAVLLLAWPVKNLLVFGQLTSSSWQGWNLINATEVDAGALSEFWREGRFPGELAEAVPIPAWIDAEGRESLTRPRKRWPWPEDEKPVEWVREGEVPNGNHLIFLVENRELSSQGVRWRLENPSRWLASAWTYYVNYTHLPSIVPYAPGESGRPYEWTLEGSGHPRYASYTAAYVRLLYFDAFALWNALFPGLPQAGDMAGRSWFVARLPFYGAVVLPAVLAFAAFSAWRFARRRSWRQALLALCLSAIVWNLAVSVLTDGWESMRFRFATAPMALVVLCSMAAGLRHRLRLRHRARLRARRRGDAAQPSPSSAAGTSGSKR